MITKKLMALAAFLVLMATPPAVGQNPFIKGFFVSVVTCQNNDADQLFIELSLADDVDAYLAAMANGVSFTTSNGLISALTTKQASLKSFQNVTFSYDGKTKLRSATLNQPLFGDVRYVQVSGDHWECHTTSPFVPEVITPMLCKLASTGIR